ncbi:bifunctional diaminohydroxyphosphoribosylaminopyrimidine deaminase/5-amino-6-(5-phosphoribosylamino)uracil reductase RibD [Desulfopila sp. IMCC35006]|uniref:bifunctional diaminohydroxyphosphoribosylaminopyrimidine deaminase/5-amino-6-(5-phosphoribosylamino)uracil reductase RibD n=1 Tax=Desulfopila sp. IMCC35006 TaxID=2569542 RepID=UPI0010AC1DB5|nr:bifunctional diaminohydroxyphosphoribosylaminopyrimidine deaminase/5-amino-6-(5-phosphoribosylamino)uracil reductase RibD [Desulfopila sp. IMCC35006]TKB28103.1 bifunctional diaminohydroxyphosphoribosylaminopyrimidine deaminase/5-amino-6-(5-phosphoribosylamino)uracil reductase RibD [Desulfopila sp. IMCC35006]
MKEKQDNHFMRLALREAAKGLGRTSPNPCVGAVIVKDGKVLGKGYHKKAGTPHAEIHALRNAAASVRGATLYVTLEPCNHTGRTPPCSRAVLEAGIVRVVIGMTDPNPLVNGGGIEFLRSHRIEVISGVLEQECAALNHPFVKHITEGTPWVIMKAGVSLDGRLNYQAGQTGWITGAQSVRAVHKLRDRVDAILVGRKTVEIDNPSLTTRLGRGSAKDPIRIILDTDLATPVASRVYHLESKAPTWIVCATDAPDAKKEAFQEIGIRLLKLPRTETGVDLRSLLKVLGQENICSLLVEGGAMVHGAFLREKLFDYAHLFYAPLFAGSQGVPLIDGYQVQHRDVAPYLAGLSHKRLGDDIMLSGKVCYR